LQAIHTFIAILVGHVDGALNAPTAHGSNRLIQQGAKLVMDASDILDDLQILLPQKEKWPEAVARLAPELSSDERRVYDAINPTETPIDRIATTYHAWRGESEAGEYADAPGYCRAAPVEEIREHDFMLTPGRYVAAPAEVGTGADLSAVIRSLREDLLRSRDTAALVMGILDRIDT